jgi:membrane-bound lytic murein transglycosylase D
MVVFRASLAVALVALLSSPARAQTTASPEQSAYQQRRIAQIIQNVEAAYQNGLSNYHDGHLAAAKSNFNYAVDTMLTCGIDIKSDPQLSDEFDRIVDAVNTLEMDALNHGNGLAPEPTPVGVANDVTFPVDPTIRAEAEAQIKTTQSDLPLVMNDYVASFINFFSKSKTGRGTIFASLDRAGRYKDIIQRVLKEEGVPQDLIYQAVAESGFRPQAVNPHSGAAGMWQFMPYGVYGLARTGWYDERFDPEKSTRAYAREIKKNYEQLGDWYLAMAAYDWGAGNIQRAVQRTGYADFWELYRRNNLPAETKNYVPIILAVTIMAKNPKEYGLDDLTPDPPLVDDTVQTDYSVGLPLVADLVGAPVQEIVGLNPSLLRGATPPDETFDLHLPTGTKDLFEKGIEGIPVDKRRYWRYHTLAANETLEDVARTFHVSVREIADVNQLSSTTDLDGVDAVVVPVAPVISASSSSTFYRARRGDTLVTVADRFGVTVAQLRRWNHLRSSAITPGRKLYVAEPAHIPHSYRRGKRRASYASHGSSQSGSHQATKARSAKTAPRPASKVSTTAKSQRAGKSSTARNHA